MRRPYGIPERPRHPISAFRRAFAVSRSRGPRAGIRVLAPEHAGKREKSVRRALTATVAAAAVASALVAAPAASAAPASIAWGPCTDPTLVAAGAECGYLGVRSE